jgi:hypothetical protein
LPASCADSALRLSNDADAARDYAFVLRLIDEMKAEDGNQNALKRADLAAMYADLPDLLEDKIRKTPAHINEPGVEKLHADACQSRGCFLGATASIQQRAHAGSEQDQARRFRNWHSIPPT